MAEVFLNPEKFQKQIDSFESSANTIKALKYSVDSQSARLQSLDRFIECINELNDTIVLLGKLLDLDTNSMKLIKAKWMNTDSDIATKSLKEVLFG